MGEYAHNSQELWLICFKNSLIGFRTGRDFPPPHGLIANSLRYVTVVIQKNPPIPLPPAGGTRRRPTPTGIFIKTQRPTAAVPLVPTMRPHIPYPSSPSRFLRDVGAATRVGAATVRTQNIDHRKKSRRITVISRNRVLESTRPFATDSPQVVSLRLAVYKSDRPFIFPSPLPGVLPYAPNKWCRRRPAAHTESRTHTSHNFLECNSRTRSSRLAREFENLSRV